ncbi:MAG TPA: AbrB/MazE/SpoVT family DNA-binding domain-containing protein [Gemmatimonadaceae bacterium]|jgi:AbrB family looped-hinge helix DNA binding protein
MSEATITSKGQITIPKAVRERLQLEPGDIVTFDVRDDGTVVLVARNEPLERLVGMLASPRTSGGGRRKLSIEEMNPASLADDGR